MLRLEEIFFVSFHPQFIEFTPYVHFQKREERQNYIFFATVLNHCSRERLHYIYFVARDDNVLNDFIKMSQWYPLESILNIFFCVKGLTNVLKFKIIWNFYFYFTKVFLFRKHPLTILNVTLVFIWVNIFFGQQMLEWK